MDAQDETGLGPETPAIRAGFLKNVWASIDDLGVEVAQLIRPRVSEANQERIAHASRTEWLPADVLMEIDEAIWAEVGATGLRDFWRGFSRQATRIPLLRAIAAGAMRVFGSPKGLFKVLPRAWSSMARNLGDVQVDASADDKRITVRVDGALLSRPELFRMGNEGSYLGVLDMVGAKGGHVVCESHDRAAGNYVFVVRWDVEAEPEAEPDDSDADSARAERGSP